MEKRTEKLIRIAIIGPESTGKTTLCEELADYYKTNWVPEYAREYIDKVGRKYTLNDIEIVAKKQLELENEMALTTNHVLFCDTNAIVTKIWAEVVFNKSTITIDELAKASNYDLYLLTDIDINWVPDSQREHPTQRQEIYNLYKAYLEKNTLLYKQINGTGKGRTKNAIDIIDPFIIASQK